MRLLPVVLLSCAGIMDTPAADPVEIRVDPTCRRSINGISELRREAYFSLCDQGTGFDHRAAAEHLERLAGQAGIAFGRRLGVVNGVKDNASAVREDPSRPGFIDRELLLRHLERNRIASTAALRTRMGDGMVIAAHETKDAYPAFMGRHRMEGIKEAEVRDGVPANAAAAAELAACMLRHGFTDQDRPRYYELINEPHWGLWRDPFFARWHLETLDQVHAQAPGVQVGGPCLPIAQFARNGYKSFAPFRQFIANTDGRLDFYSFHVYDYLKAQDGRFAGRITSGLPLEGVMDLIQGHGQATYGHPLKIVVSEHGGYGADDLVLSRARETFHGDPDSFDFEMHRRAIDDYNMVSSAIGNTMVFLEHPDTVLKAVPFILYETTGWDPRFYSTIYVREGFTRKGAWRISQRIAFYDLFRDLRGSRIRADCGDQDLQVAAFRDGPRCLTVINNLSEQGREVRLTLPEGAVPPYRTTIRRFGRNADGTGRLSETLQDMDAAGAGRIGGWRIPIDGRDALVVIQDYPSGLRADFSHSIDERTFHGTLTVADGGTAGTIRIPPAVLTHVETAQLRIGISRGDASDLTLTVTCNGVPVPCPVEDSASRYTEAGGEYASCRLVRLDPSLIAPDTVISVSVPVAGPCTIGTIALRLGIAERP